MSRTPRVVVADRQRSLEIDGPRLERDLAQVIERSVFGGDLSVSLVDDDEIARLHADFSDDPTSTDVLAFPLDVPPGDLPADGFWPRGEVVLSVETAVREAARRDLDPLGEVMLYAVHGLLHLCGEDDHDPVKARRMDRLTLELLEGVGIRHRIDRPE